MGEGQFFPPLPQKMPILFHSGNKRQFKLCSKSVSNYQNQLVEAEKLFKKKSHFCLIPLYAVTHKTKVFGDYNQARLEVSWITSTRGLLLRGYIGMPW